MTYTSLEVSSGSVGYFEGWPQDNTKRSQMMAFLIGVNFCRAIEQKTNDAEQQLRSCYDSKEWEMITSYAQQFPNIEDGLSQEAKKEQNNRYKNWQSSPQKCQNLLDFIQTHPFCQIAPDTHYGKFAVHATRITSMAEITSLKLNINMDRITFLKQKILQFNRITLLVIAECARAVLEQEARRGFVPFAHRQDPSASSSSTQPEREGSSQGSSSSQQQETADTSTATTPLLRQDFMPAYQQPVRSASAVSVSPPPDEGCCCVIQ